MEELLAKYIKENGPLSREELHYLLEEDFKAALTSLKQGRKKTCHGYQRCYSLPVSESPKIADNTETSSMEAWKIILDELFADKGALSSKDITLIIQGQLKEALKEHYLYTLSRYGKGHWKRVWKPRKTEK